MNLKDRLLNISTVESNWAVYADTPFSESSETRIGQMQFKNGGLLDENEIVGLEQLHDSRLNAQIDSLTATKITSAKLLLKHSLMNSKERLEMEFAEPAIRDEFGNIIVSASECM